MLGLGLLFFVSACSSESPTAPTTGGGTGGGGTPPQSASIAVSVSNANPVVSSTSTITATVTQNGQPVPDGTAVEFSTTLGTFTDTASSTSLRTTTNGVATAVLTSGEAGQARVTVRVNNVNRTVDVQFRVSDGGSGGVTITAVDPATSAPGGGQIISIRGTGFQAPVRVLFGNREANVVSVTPTEIRVVVPSITLGATEQAREVNVVVINNAGNEGEQSVTAPTPFRYQIEVLTPVVYGLSPASGPREGRTRIVITGEGFQAPVKVYFGTAGGPGPLTNQTELEVLRVSYGQIEAITPPIWDIYGVPADVAPTTSQMTVRVQNLATNTEAIQPLAFRYGPLMQITAVGPTEGPYTGGTQVTINGWGFDDPVAVTVGGVAAQPIRVSGSEIVVRTSAVQVNECGDVDGDIVVTNIEDGATAEFGTPFIYRVPQASIIGLSPSDPAAGGSTQVTVFGAGNPAFARFKVGTTNVFPSNFTVNPDGTVTFNVVIPSNLELDTRECPAGGERQVATNFDLTYLNTQTGCEDVLEGAISVQPALAPVLFVTTPANLDDTTVGSSSSTTFSVVNAGTSAMTFTSVSSNSAAFTVTANPAPPVGLDPCESSEVTVTFTPAAAGQQTATITIVTDAGTRSVQVQGNGVAPAP